MTSLLSCLSGILGDAFAAHNLPRDLGVVTPSDRPDLAPFQCNGALAAAKIAREAPRAVAGAIIETLSARDELSAVSIAGPGFINLTPSDTCLTQKYHELSQDEKLGGWQTPVPQKLLVDYGGPNVAKPLHVGHLRAAIIGESLKRLARFVGDEAMGDIHLGDWGKQMGQLIAQIQLEQPHLSYFDAGYDRPYPDESPVSLADLTRIYPIGAAACKQDPARDRRAREMTSDLQAGRPGYRALWHHFITVSRAGLERDYQDLGVSFELWKGESDADPFIDNVVNLLEAKNLLEADEGARIVRVTREEDRKEIPPLIMFSKDGAVLYGSTDLATIYDRVNNHGIDHIWYVVDQRQSVHFEQVFRVAGAAGMMAPEQLEHIGFGTMNGTDGRPFKTREGGILQLRDLLDMVFDRAMERLEESGTAHRFSPEETTEIARLVGLAALKFADLSNPRLSDYVFDLDRFTAFEGKTGPYLLYAAVRIKSVLKKAENVPHAPDHEESKYGGHGSEASAIAFTHDAERHLALSLMAFPEVVKTAYDRRAPHIMADHAFRLAQSFSKFYAACRIADEENTKSRNTRLSLVRTVAAQLDIVFDILTIEIPARM